MRSLLTLPSIALLGLGVGACGNTGRGTGSAPGSSSNVATRTAVAAKQTQSRLPTDSDNDNDNPGKSRYDGDDGPVLHFGHAASAAEERAVAALVKRYYAAGAAGDGATACSLIDSLLAESVVEEYAQSPALRGKTCAEVLSKLFRRRHRELAGDIATLKPTVVRVSGDRGLALVRFGATRERRLLLRRERGAWKMDVLLDVGVP
jgi:hypothetical protein